MRAAALLATAFLALPAPLGAQMEITETLWLTGSAAQPGAQLGTAVAIDGDVAVLGAPYQDVAGVPNAGLVVVYERRHGFWTEAQLLNAPIPGLGDEFGRRVAVGGDTIAVGSRKTLPGGKPGTVHAAFVPAALQDALLVTELPAELASPWGTVLCDPASAVGWFQGPPGAPFQLAIPAACSLVGRTFCVQGAAFDAGGISALTNALDLVLGTY